MGGLIHDLVWRHRQKKGVTVILVVVGPNEMAGHVLDCVTQGYQYVGMDALEARGVTCPLCKYWEGEDGLTVFGMLCMAFPCAIFVCRCFGMQEELPTVQSLA
jgi:hypothetical protein